MLNTNIGSVSAMPWLSLIKKKVNTCHWVVWLLC